MSQEHSVGTARPTLDERVRAMALDHGFDAAGIARIRSSEHAAFYRTWIERGYHGAMDYLARPNAVEARLQPASRFEDLTSALVVAQHYDPSHDGGADDASKGVIARYARGRDYHRVMKKKLLAVLADIETEVGHELPAARAYVDTGPVLERELARRAGLGWYGRNTMLIHPRRGSYFFLGSLLLDLDLEPDAPFERDHCGTCHACVNACPTGALLGRDENGAPVMDARLCISYLTIENRGPIPVELRPLIGNRVFGCDICQEVCPFTRFSGPASEPAYAARAPGELPFGVDPEPGPHASHPGTAAPSLIDLLWTVLDESAWDSFSRGSAIRRAGRAGFARNVCVGLGNWASSAAVPALAAALSDPGPLVRGHAAWALGEIDSAAARASLRDALEAEADPFVRSEVEAALVADAPPGSARMHRQRS